MVISLCGIFAVSAAVLTRRLQHTRDASVAQTAQV